MVVVVTTPGKYGGCGGGAAGGREECEKARSCRNNSWTLKKLKALRKDTRQEQEAPDRKRIISESIA